MPPGIETTFCPIRSLDLPGRASDDHRVDEQDRAMPADVLRAVAEAAARRACVEAGIDAGDATVLTPDYGSGFWPTTSSHQLFAELRVETPIKTDVVLVPRRRTLAPDRNQPDSWWEDLAGALQASGLSVEMYPMRPAAADARVGRREGVAADPRVGRGLLDEAIKLLSAARLAAGASTGGLHLASLCRCPHYVWGSGPEARWTPWAITNRQRYETVWNPFGTPCRYDECGWRPTMEQVVAGIRRALDEIGIPRDGAAPVWTLKPRWRIKRRLARLLEPPIGRGLLPRRVRRFVRQNVL